MTETPLVLRALEGNEPVSVSPLQEFILSNMQSFERAWAFVFIAVLAYMLYVLYREYCR